MIEPLRIDILIERDDERPEDRPAADRVDPRTGGDRRRRYRVKLWQEVCGVCEFSWSEADQSELGALLNEGGSDPAEAHLIDVMAVWVYEGGLLRARPALQEAVYARRPVHVTFSASSSSLYGLPWEVLPLQADDLPLARTPGLIIRFEPFEDDRSGPARGTPSTTDPVEEGGRVMLAWADPGGGGLPHAEHGEAARRAVESLDDPTIRYEELAGATLSSLHARLSAAGAPVNVLQILCPRGPSGAGPRGIRLLDGVADGAALAACIAPFARHLRVVMITVATGPATVLSGDEVQGLVNPLLRAGVPAVMVCRNVFGPTSATVFVEGFYRAILEDAHSLFEAYELGRLAMRDDAGLVQVHAARTTPWDARPFVRRSHPGQRPYREQDRGLYAGRDADVDTIAAAIEELVAPDAPSDRARLVLVHGASRSGKTSLGRAGLVRRFQPDRAEWRMAYFEHPDAVRAPEWFDGDDERAALVVVDAVGLGPRGLGEQLEHLLQATTRPAQRVVVVLLVRSAFLPAVLDALDRLPTAGPPITPATVYRLEPLPTKALREALEVPVRRAGMVLPEALATGIVQALEGRAGALPLLQAVVEELWQRRTSRQLGGGSTSASTLLAAAIRRLGGPLPPPDDPSGRITGFLLAVLAAAPRHRATGHRARVPDWSLLPADAAVAQHFSAVVDAAVATGLVEEGLGEADDRTLEVADPRFIDALPLTLKKNADLARTAATHLHAVLGNRRRRSGDRTTMPGLTAEEARQADAALKDWTNLLSSEASRRLRAALPAPVPPPMPTPSLSPPLTPGLPSAIPAEPRRDSTAGPRANSAAHATARTAAPGTEAGHSSAAIGLRVALLAGILALTGGGGAVIYAMLDSLKPKPPPTAVTPGTGTSPEHARRLAMARNWLENAPTTGALLLLEVKEPVDAPGWIQESIHALSSPVLVRSWPAERSEACPDGSVVTVDPDGMVRVWPREVTRAPLDLGKVEAPASDLLCGAGRVAVASGDRRVHIWPVEGGEAAVTSTLGGVIQQMVFAGQGRTLLAASAGGLYAFQVNDPRRRMAFDVESPYLIGGTVGGDAVFAYPCGRGSDLSDRCTAAWKPGSAGDPFGIQEMPPGRVRDLALSPDGGTLAAARSARGDAGVFTWDWRTRRGITGQAQEAGTLRVVWNADGRSGGALSVNGSGESARIRVYGWGEGMRGSADVTCARADDESTPMFAWHPAGLEAAAACGKELSYVPFRGKAGPRRVYTRAEKWTEAFYTGDGEYFMAHAGDGWWWVDPAPARSTVRWPGDPAPLVVQASDDAKVALVGLPGGVLGRGDVSGVGRSVVGSFDDVIWSPDGARAVLLAEADGTTSVRLSGQTVVALPDGAAGLVCEEACRGPRPIGWSPDSSAVAMVLRSGEIGVFDGVTGVERRRVVVGKVVDLELDNSGDLLVADDSGVRLWAATSAEPLVLVNGPARDVELVGDSVVVAAESRLLRVPRIGGAATLDEAIAQAPAQGVAVSADGQTVVVHLADGTLLAWPAGGAVRTLGNHDGLVLGARVSPDGQQVLSWGEDGTARLWTMQAGEVPVRFDAESFVLDAAWNADGSEILAVDADGNAWRWPTTIDGLRAALRGTTSLCLTAVQRQQLLGEDEARALERAKACGSPGG